VHAGADGAGMEGVDEQRPVQARLVQGGPQRAQTAAIMLGAPYPAKPANAVSIGYSLGPPYGKYL